MNAQVQLAVANSSCKIAGLTGAQFSALKNAMSYSLPKNKYQTKTYYTKKSLLHKNGIFPTGLLYIAQRFLKYHKIKPYILDHRVEPIHEHTKFKIISDVKPYSEQIEAAEAAAKYKRGIIVAPTGVGKTLIAGLIIEKLSVRTLIVVPSLELKDQTIQALRSLFGKQRVGEFGGQLQDIAVANVDSLDYKKPLIGYDCVIIDEFHHSGAATYRKLNKHSWQTVHYKFGLTATPFRSQDEERLLLESVLSKVIYRIEYKTAVEKGYIVPLEAYYIEVPVSLTDAYTWPEVYDKLVVNHEIRNKKIRDLLTSLWQDGKSTICLVKEIAHGKILQEDTPGCSFVNGRDEYSRQNITAFNENRCISLVGTAGVLGEGVDTKPAEYVIIAGLGKSKNAFMQQCGRAFRIYPEKKSAKIIIFKDNSHKFTLTHFKAQCKFLKDEYNVKPIKLECNK